MAELDCIQDAQTNQHNDQAEQAKQMLWELLHGSQNPLEAAGKKEVWDAFENQCQTKGAHKIFHLMTFI